MEDCKRIRHSPDLDQPTWEELRHDGVAPVSYPDFTSAGVLSILPVDRVVP